MRSDAVEAHYWRGQIPFESSWLTFFDYIMGFLHSPLHPKISTVYPFILQNKTNLQKMHPSLLHSLLSLVLSSTTPF